MNDGKPARLTAAVALLLCALAAPAAAALKAGDVDTPIAAVPFAVIVNPARGTSPA